MPFEKSEHIELIVEQNRFTERLMSSVSLAVILSALGHKKMKDRMYKQIKSHLANYKINILNIEENGTWWKNKKEYAHILPEKEYNRNIIDGNFENDLRELLNTQDRHLGFHHLNSSQALALNLFGPLIVSGRLDMIFKLLHIKVENIIGSKFEYIANTNENTNFDFFIQGEPTKIFFEVKYTENKFGNAKDDDRHQNKYQKIYKENLSCNVEITRKEFLGNYQLWRNLLYSEAGIVVFVLPKFRIDLIEQVQSAKIRLRKAENVKILLIDDLVEKCISENKLFEHYSEFNNKYLKFVSDL